MFAGRKLGVRDERIDRAIKCPFSLEWMILAEEWIRWVLASHHECRYAHFE